MRQSVYWKVSVDWGGGEGGLPVERHDVGVQACA